MQSLTTAHYQKLLGLPSTWMVENVDLSMTAMQVVIRLVYTGKNAVCPECGKTCSIYDQAPEQKWRHLDTMQFETIIVARLPRTNCKEHGVRTVGGPWADRHSRFTDFQVITVKDMMRRHLENILNHFKHRTTNAVSEGLNSKIQLLKASSRGFHSVERYRVRILFYYGKLDMAIS
jgi:transposase